MTDYTIPMIIGMTLAFTLGAVFGALWGLSRHEWLYCRVTAHLTWRMREAMKSLGIDEWKIDKAQEYMGSVIIPPHIPMPEPPVKAASEREQCQTCLSIAECEQARPQVKEECDFDKEPYTMDEAAQMTYLTRAWLIEHGWKPTKNIPLFQHDPECIDADLCVIVDRKDYMIAKFHYMGDDAWKPDAKPDSFELVGVNNSIDMLEYDHTRLVMAAYVCHLTGFEPIDKAIGGVYEMTMNCKEWD